MKNHFKFHSELVLRTPNLAFKTENVDEDTLKKVCYESWFQEAIYLASPDLHNMLLEWIAGLSFEKRTHEKFLYSIGKYYSRMMSRSTPFGLFAACSVVHWAEKDKIVFESQENYRQTRFDMHFTCALSLELVKNRSIKTLLFYSLNTSLYSLGKELRYIEYTYLNGRRSHQISAIENTEYIQKVIDAAQDQISYLELIEILTIDGIAIEEASVFIDELIDNQILVHNLEPSITGGDFISQIILILEKSTDLGLKGLVSELSNLKLEINKLDLLSENTVNDYRKIKDKLKNLNLVFEENKLFQTDLFKRIKTGKVDNKWQDAISESLDVLNRLTIKNEKTALTDFVSRFSKRYEEQQISLLEALDTETGIGYLEKNNGNTLNPLIEELVLPFKENHESANWDFCSNFLFKKLKTAIEESQTTIEIFETDIKELAEANWSDLPPSMSVMFRIVDDEQETKKILFQSVSGSSAANLLGRFAQSDSQINDIVKEISNFEQDNNPDIIFAEIIHLPESRTGNILLHPVFREYEIPFLGKSSLKKEYQIELQDIYISTKHGKLILWSKRLNKQIIPRLSNAHNYSNNALPIYQFLCDLQHQNLRSSFSFNWGMLEEKFDFLPRVVYKNVILAPASWKINSTDFYLLFDINEAFYKNFPRFMVLAEGDNELLIDWQSQLSIETFKNTIKGKKRIVLKEFLFEKNNITVKNNLNEGYINQFVASILKQDSTYFKPKFNFEMQNIERNFTVGSEWLYFKIYLGVKVADVFLIEVVKPLKEFLIQNILIDNWFFIRYNDPDHHIRLRFHLNDFSKIGEVIQAFHQFVLPMEQSKQISKTQIDTYNRELERYGHENIVVSEKLFFYNSETVLEFLNLTEGDERENLRWLIGLKLIDRFLSDFTISHKKCFEIMEILKTSFAKEFDMDQNLKKQLDERYRKEKEHIFNFLEDDFLKVHHKKFYKFFEKNSKNSKPFIHQILNVEKNNTLKVEFESLVISHIHMIVNRLIPSNQRLHEMVIYDFLYRYYLTKTKRINQ